VDRKTPTLTVAARMATGFGVSLPQFREEYGLYFEADVSHLFDNSDERECGYHPVVVGTVP
jgi:hypothetical protein